MRLVRLILVTILILFITAACSNKDSAVYKYPEDTVKESLLKTSHQDEFRFIDSGNHNDKFIVYYILGDKHYFQWVKWVGKGFKVEGSPVVPEIMENDKIVTLRALTTKGGT